MLDFLYLTEGAAPPNPPPNRVAVYAKTDHNLYYKAFNGAEIQILSSTSGTTAAVSAAYPVGSIFISVLATDPSVQLGIGTWAIFGAGKVLVSLAAGDPDFGTVEATGGEKTHVLTTPEMPSHTHTQNSHTHTDSGHSHSQDGNTALRAAGAVLSVTGGTTAAIGGATALAAAVISSTTATNQNTGGDGAHNNLQPFIVVYMWKRTA